MGGDGGGGGRGGGGGDEHYHDVFIAWKSIDIVSLLFHFPSVFNAMCVVRSSSPIPRNGNANRSSTEHVVRCMACVDVGARGGFVCLRNNERNKTHGAHLTDVCNGRKYCDSVETMCVRVYLLPANGNDAKPCEYPIGGTGNTLNENNNAYNDESSSGGRLHSIISFERWNRDATNQVLNFVLCQFGFGVTVIKLPVCRVYGLHCVADGRWPMADNKSAMKYRLNNFQLSWVFSHANTNFGAEATQSVRSI